MTCLPPKSKVMSIFGPGILSRAEPWSKALKQPRGPELLSVAPVATESHAKARVIGYHMLVSWGFILP